MFEKFGFCFIFFVGLATMVYADTIYLKSGEVVTGEIMDSKDSYTTIMQGNFPAKYYAYEIEKIVKDEDVKYSGIDLTQFRDISLRKSKLIVRLMEANSTRKILEENIKQIIASSPPGKKEEIEKLFNASAIISRLVPVYDRYYSDQELQQLIDFYSSPIGQKLVETTPKITEDVMKTSVQYFQENVKH